MKHPCCIPILALLLLSYGPSTASAQAIPIDIPDTPGESPADRERQKNEERHHATFSRLFGTTSVVASPLMNQSGIVFDTILEGGVQIQDGDALYLVVGARSAPILDAEGSPSVQSRDAGRLFALGYEVGLARFSTHALVANSVVGLTVGGWFGNTSLLSVDVSPRYVLRANPYWSLPVGLKVSTAFVSDSGNPVTLVGLSMGIRRHFGQRESLEH